MNMTRQSLDFQSALKIMGQLNRAGEARQTAMGAERVTDNSAGCSMFRLVALDGDLVRRDDLPPQASSAGAPVHPRPSSSTTSSGAAIGRSPRLARVARGRIALRGTAPPPRVVTPASCSSGA